MNTSHQTLALTTLAVLIFPATAGALDFTYQHSSGTTLTFSDPGCTSGFEMNNGAIICSNSPPTLQPVGSCSVTASKATVYVGDTVTLTASCPNATGYEWRQTDANGNTLGTSAAYSPSTAAAGSATYYVKGFNSLPSENSTTKLVTVQTAPAAGSWPANTVVITDANRLLTASTQSEASAPGYNRLAFGQAFDVAQSISDFFPENLTAQGTTVYAKIKSYEFTNNNAAAVHGMLSLASSSYAGNIAKEIAVASAPGVFDVDTKCKLTNVSTSGRLYWSSNGLAFPVSGVNRNSCAIPVGQKMYLNVKSSVDGTTQNSFLMSNTILP